MRHARYFPLLIALTLISFLGTGCDVLSGQSAEQVLSFEPIEEARSLNVPEPQTAVFRSEDQWQDFWDRRVDAAEDGTKPPPPNVDFETEMAIGLFWGTISGCSSSVDAIQEVSENDRSIAVQVEDWTGGIICTALVQPRQVIRIEKSEKPVSFVGNAVPGA